MINYLRGFLDGLASMSRKEAFRKELKRRFPDATFEPSVIVKGPLNNLKLGSRVVVQSNTVLHLGGMPWCNNAGYLEIGDDSLISPNGILYGTGPGGIRIGKRFVCGPGVSVFAASTDYKKGKDNHVFLPVEIGNDVIVYSNAIISPGSVVGDGAVIAAGAVVTGEIPSNCLVSESPAVVIRQNIR